MSDTRSVAVTASELVGGWRYLGWDITYDDGRVTHPGRLLAGELRLLKRTVTVIVAPGPTVAWTTAAALLPPVRSTALVVPWTT